MLRGLLAYRGWMCKTIFIVFRGPSIVLMIVWYLDLQLSMQLVPITTNVVSSKPVHGKLYSIQHYVIKFVSDWRQVCVFSGYSGFLHQ